MLSKIGDLMEDELFKKYRVNKDSLIPYGFIKKNNSYTYKKEILNNTFQVQIILTSKISIKVIDLDFGDEYLNYRRKDEIGDFAGEVRQEIEKTLLDIRDNCYINQNFFSNQANRITSLIHEEYNDNPEFLWEDTDAGVFRNSHSKKWYGIIMNVERGKVDKNTSKKEESVDVLNVKLSSEEIVALVEKPGYFSAYHMNKKYWISIILDDTLSDEEIMKYLNKSHKNTD